MTFSCLIVLFPFHCSVSFPLVLFYFFSPSFSFLLPYRVLSHCFFSLFFFLVLFALFVSHVLFMSYSFAFILFLVLFFFLFCVLSCCFSFLLPCLVLYQLFPVELWHSKCALFIGFLWLRSIFQEVLVFTCSFDICQNSRSGHGILSVNINSSLLKTLGRSILTYHRKS